MPEREKDTKPELKGFQISLSQKQFFSWEPLVSLNKALVGPYFLGGGVALGGSPYSFFDLFKTVLATSY